MSGNQNSGRKPPRSDGAPPGNRVKDSSEKTGRWSACQALNPDKGSNSYKGPEQELGTSDSRSQGLTSNQRDPNAWLNQSAYQWETSGSVRRSYAPGSNSRQPVSPTGAQPKQSFPNHRQRPASEYSSLESDAQGASSKRSFSAANFKELRPNPQSCRHHEAESQLSRPSIDQARAEDDASKESENEMESRTDDCGVSDKEGPREPKTGANYCKGVPLTMLKRAPECYVSASQVLPELKASHDHKVFFYIPKKGWLNALPSPYCVKDHDRVWQDEFVYMPYAKQNRDWYRRQGSNWDIITAELKNRICSIKDLKGAISSYNYSCHGLETLEHYFQSDRAAEARFFADTLPKMQKLALNLPLFCGKPVPILKKGMNTKLTFTQQQIACLLANAFFCTFPDRDAKYKGQTLPHFNFTNLLSSHSSDSAIFRKVQKIKCILNYFERVTTDMPTGTVSYARHSLHHSNKPEWRELKKTFTELHVSAYGTIEDDGKGMLQVDFANKYVGGGVIGGGLVQEEIRFVLCPEMILSRLFTEVLQDNEVLIMTGCERFSDYKGYADTFEYMGNHTDNTPRDAWGRRYTEVVAMDALVVRNYNCQFEKRQVLRELNKAYCAFKGYEFKRNLPAVRTSNWGCGAFGGNKQLKALIQMMAASEAGRDICYFTFGDEKFCDELAAMRNIIKKQNLKISNVIELIDQYFTKFLSSPANTKSTISLFGFICMMFSTNMEEAGSDDYCDSDY